MATTMGLGRFTRQRGPRTGFTLIELLVVIVLIGLLVALILPAIQDAREAARALTCRNNLKQLGVAFNIHHERRGQFPPGISPWPAGNHSDVITNWGWGWATSLLADLEQRGVYNALNFDVPLADMTQMTATRTTVAVFLCPSSSSGAVETHYGNLSFPGHTRFMSPSQYVASAGTVVALARTPPDGFTYDLRGDGVFSFNRAMSLRDITDGASSTILVGERSRVIADASLMGSPMFALPICSRDVNASQSCVSSAFLVLGRTGGQDKDLHFTGRKSRGTLDPSGVGPDGFSSPHASGCPFLFADGSCRSLRFTIADSVLRSLATRSGGEVLSSDQF